MSLAAVGAKKSSDLMWNFASVNMRTANGKWEKILRKFVDLELHVLCLQAVRADHCR